MLEIHSDSQSVHIYKESTMGLAIIILFVCLLFPYCFNAVEAKVELFMLKLNMAHYKNKQ